MAELTWRIERWAYERFMELVATLGNFETESDEAYAIRDEIRSLPGFPLDNDEDQDVIYFEFTDKSFLQ